jgi:hypothetical protein
MKEQKPPFDRPPSGPAWAKLEGRVIALEGRVAELEKDLGGEIAANTEVCSALTKWVDACVAELGSYGLKPNEALRALQLTMRALLARRLGDPE